MMSEKKSMQQLWQDYLFLSKELHKFTAADDMGMLQNLMEQRETMLTLIKEAENHDTEGYIKNEEGQKLIKEIVALDAQLQKKIAIERNLLKKNMEVSTAYDGFFGEAMSIGNRFDSSSK